MIKYFFMAVVNATLQGRPVVQFNTVSSLNNPDLTAGAIGAIQEGAANMANAQGTQFDDLVIQNLFCLTPNGMTEEQFTAGTALAQPQQADNEEPLAAEDDTSSQYYADGQVEETDPITQQRSQVVENFQNQVQNAANEAVADDHAQSENDGQALGNSL